MGAEAGIVDKSGSWFAFNGERLGQGRENVRAMLDENLDLRQSIENALRAHLGFNPGSVSTSAAGDSDFPPLDD